MQIIIRGKILYAIIIAVCMLCIFSTIVFAQDTTKTVSDSTNMAISTDNDVEIGDVELIEITIEAEIEKPRVAILPKRMEPELGEMELIDRSFENELKQGPDKPFLIKERVKVSQKVIKSKDDKKENK